jgi:hypothetical protein
VFGHQTLGFFQLDSEISTKTTMFMTEDTKLSQADVDQLLGFVSDDDQPIRYMQRTRDWYLGLGFYALAQAS